MNNINNRIMHPRDILREARLNNGIIATKNRRMNEGLKKLNDSSFELIKNDRIDTDYETGKKEGLFKNANKRVVSTDATNHPVYTQINNNQFRTETSKIGNVNRIIIDVDTTRSFSEKLANSKLTQRAQGHFINKDILIYKNLTKERIHEADDNIRNSYVGSENKFLGFNENPQNSQNFQSVIPGNMNTSNIVFDQLKTKYGIVLPNSTPNPVNNNK